MPYYYVSLQYSAIQKAVLRHDRLWSMAGVSQILSQLNEIDLPAETKKLNGEVLVAGGGKFTARFWNRSSAELARTAMIRIIATTLPMLEFQYSEEIVEADSLQDARNNNNLILKLNEQKAKFRGYGLTYNPHLRICDECGEYPAIPQGKQDSHRCRFCNHAKYIRRDIAFINPNIEQELTSVEKIYLKYLKQLDVTVDQRRNLKIPDDFSNLFPEQQKDGYTGEAGEHKRMAVWLSDTNNMNTKVPIWLSQEDDHVPRIFNDLREKYVNITATALKTVFPSETWNGGPEKETYLPFRLIIAGGDDLCIVMAEQFVLDFAIALSKSYNDNITSITENDFLSTEWLRKHALKEKSVEPGPFCFGGAFVITSVHTPFKLIHHLGEELMGKAKKTTNRQANCVDWRVLSVEEKSVSDNLMPFEKPVFIHDPPNRTDIPETMRDALTLEDYLLLKRQYQDREIGLSGSQIKKIVAAIIQSNGDPVRLDELLIKASAAGMEKGMKYILADDRFRNPEGILIPGRIGTLLELLSIENPETGGRSS